MNNTLKYYAAPWGRKLILTSLFVIAVCVAGIMMPWLFGKTLAMWKTTLLVALLVLPVFFIIRGYEIGESDLFVKRLLWRTRIPLADLESAEFMPHAMKGSIRSFGNGGAYSVTGWFRSRTFGSYRAFVNNDANTVVLRFGSRTIVISPEHPEVFIADLQTHLPKA